MHINERGVIMTLDTVDLFNVGLLLENVRRCHTFGRESRMPYIEGAHWIPKPKT